jgi:hypothetical protein
MVAGSRITSRLFDSIFISFGKAAAWARAKVPRRENKQPSHILINTLFPDIFHLLLNIFRVV